MAGWLEMSYGWRTHRPFLSNAAATTRSHRAPPESAARTLAASVQVAITWRGAPPKEGTPGDISPPIRPSTATSQAPRVGCCTNHIRARLQISCRSPQPLSRESPLAHLGFTAPANGATGCSLGERQNPSWIPSLTGVLLGHRACDSFNLIARSRCVFVPDHRPAHA